MDYDMSFLPHVIEHEGDNSTLVYRYKCEDLNTKSKLIVHDTQEALFFKSGQALDLFGAGAHNLKTENLPLLKKVFSKIYSGGIPFPVEVYFINKVNVLDIIWGTDAPIDVKDPEYPVIVGVRANGQTGIRIKDSRRFVLKVVGQLQDYSVDAVRRAIKGLMLASIKECIAKAIIEKGVSILKISAYLSELSQKIMANLNERVDDLGIEINHFAVSSIDTPKEDAEELRSLMDVDQEKRRMDMMGYTYHDKRKYDIAEGAATNQGMAGGLMGIGMGLGVGGVLGGTVGQMVNSQFNQTQQPVQQAQPAQPVNQAGMVACGSCGAQIAQGSKFCSNCGAPQAQQTFCPECGTKCAPGSKFCTNCGNKLA